MVLDMNAVTGSTEQYTDTVAAYRHFNGRRFVGSSKARVFKSTTKPIDYRNDLLYPWLKEDEGLGWPVEGWWKDSGIWSALLVHFVCVEQKEFDDLFTEMQ